ncbi:hypothetical protein KPH14_011413 [Odynerus spinipes]|uniref:BED-type domain-containing protein n=1 Tax=Odynerus spinipes TaxID=1348599 RepID=A0AAD9RWG4_9HYME|nr:hypothetical protein KPH14_011413 [Odynerus spinipes]
MVERTQPCVATWCPICDKCVSSKGKDTDQLLAHVRRNHRKIDEQRLGKKENTERSLERRYSNATRLTSLSCGKKKDRKRVYATRVDTWKSHDERKVCPRCQKEAVPALHTRTDNLTSSHMAAICLLG